jgi:pilus assembly protein CpaC
MHGRPRFWDGSRRTIEELGRAPSDKAAPGLGGQTESSGGEADVNSQYQNTTEIAGCGRRDQDQTTRTAAILRCAQILAALAAATMAALALAPTASQAQQPIAITTPVRTAMVLITVGKSQDVRTDRSLADIVVGNPEIADVSPLTDHSLSILGKKIGTTRVTVYDQDKRPVQIFDVEVSYDVSRLESEISRFSGGGIRVSSINGRILLSGVAPDAATLDRAMMIARQFAAADPINTVQVMAPQQVMLEVRFIEVSRQASRELGVQWNMFGRGALANVGNQLPASQLPATTPGGGFQQPGLNVGGPNVSPSNLTISPVTAAGVLSGTAPFGFLVSQLIGGHTSLDLSINALEQRGLARSLAEPNLVALSGDTASFLAGGEIPVPQASSLGAISFTYQPYGVGLSFTPTVLKDGLMDLVIKPEVSELDTNHTVTVAGTTVPGIITRRASTTLELRDGQSFMLGGLLQNSSTTAQDQLPWLGDMPVLGALFRSAEYQKNETDLVIVVTPHIVRPLRPTDPIHTPLDGSLPGNDIDFFLMGQAEVSPALVRLAAGAINRPYVGHVLDLPRRGAAHVSTKD